MALSKNVIRIPVAGAIDTKSDNKQLQPGQLATIENAVFTKSGALTKRYGFNQVATGYPTKGRSLGNFKDQLIATDGAILYGLSNTGTMSSKVGAIEAIDVRCDPIFANGEDIQEADLAVHPAGYTVVAYTTPGIGTTYLYYTVIDNLTGAITTTSMNVGSGMTKPKCIVCGDYVYIFYFDSALNCIMFKPIRIVGGVSPLTSQTASADPYTTTPIYDASLFPNGNVYLAYRNNASPNRLALRYIDTSRVTGTILSIPLEQPTNAVSIFSDASSNAWCAWNTGTMIRTLVYNSSLSSVVKTGSDAFTTFGATVKRITAVNTAPSTCSLFVESLSGSVIYPYTQRAQITTSTSSASPSFTRRIGIASKPWVSNGAAHFLGAWESFEQPTFFIYDQSANIQGKVHPGVAGGLLSSSIIPEANMSGSTGSMNNVTIATLKCNTTQYGTGTGGVTGTFATQAGVMKTKLDFGSYQDSIELGNQLYFTGASIKAFDGIRVSDAGFNLYPEAVTAATTSGGNLTVGGTYNYKLTFEKVTNDGVVQYSAPTANGPTVIITSSVGDAVAITCSNGPCTNNVFETNYIGVYRTLANGDVYYRVNTIYNSYPGSDNNIVTYLDTAADTTIMTNKQLYTTSELENIAPPSSNIMCAYKNRLVLVPCEDRYSFWYSKQVIPGTAIEFNDSFVQTVDQKGGEITGISQMDDKLIIFKSEMIYYCVGDGPSRDGSNNDLSPSQFLTADVGCTNQKSIVTTPMGLMFKSKKGIYLLSRDMSVSYIGSNVEAWNAYDVVGSVLIPNTTQVRFSLNTGDTLMFDYFHNRWSVFTGVPGANAADSVVYSGYQTVINTSGTIYKETSGSYMDLGSSIHMKVKTPWLHLSGLEGYQRIWKMLLLGDYKSPHLMKVSIGTDFVDVPQQSFNISASSAPVSGGIYQYRIDPKNQRCQAIQLELEDVPILTSGSYGESCSLSALAVEYGSAPGVKRMKPETGNK